MHLLIDIDPDNFMDALRKKQYRGGAIDFGCALFKEQWNKSLVNEGGEAHFRGTTFYAPPEAWYGEYGPFTDIYGLGSSLHRMLLGWIPYREHGILKIGDPEIQFAKLGALKNNPSVLPYNKQRIREIFGEDPKRARALEKLLGMMLSHKTEHRNAANVLDFLGYEFDVIQNPEFVEGSLEPRLRLIQKILPNISDTRTWKVASRNIERKKERTRKKRPTRLRKRGPRPRIR